MGYGDKPRSSMKTKKTFTAYSSTVSAVELRDFLEGLPDGQPVNIRLSSSQMDGTVLTIEAKL